MTGHVKHDTSDNDHEYPQTSAHSPSPAIAGRRQIFASSFACEIPEGQGVAIARPSDMVQQQSAATASHRIDLIRPVQLLSRTSDLHRLGCDLATGITHSNQQRPSRDSKLTHNDSLERSRSVHDVHFLPADHRRGLLPWSVAAGRSGTNLLVVADFRVPVLMRNTVQLHVNHA
jgi:hypothetical protein